jgi:calcineurin-like phosphoesterase family protein
MTHKIWITSDHHFGHNHILTFQPNTRQGSDIQEHNEWLVKCWNDVVGKRDTVYILGDFAFNARGILYLNRLKGQKIFIGGNHDKNLKLYVDHVNTISGIKKIKGFWLTHAPIHPQELRGGKNIHGHTHDVCIPDDKYINVSVDMNNGYPVLLDDIISGAYTTHTRGREE